MHRLSRGALDRLQREPCAPRESGHVHRRQGSLRPGYSAGFRKHDVANVSYHGREQSQLPTLDRLGQASLCHFSGDHDLFGQPAYTPGDVLDESVYRFKGQAAPAIILAEIDFDVLDDQAVR